MPIWMCLLTGLLAAGIDWSGVGPHSLRDRFAAILYLASALGWFDQLGVAAWEARMLAPLSHDARVIWAMSAVIPLAFWIGAMAPPAAFLGRFGKLQLRKGGGAGGAKAGGGKAAPAGDRLNGWLLGWTIAVAFAVPITMPASAYSAIVAAITGSVTTTATAVGTAVGGWFGWN
jgi:hypothetical protein